jgi:hypothetical protein
MFGHDADSYPLRPPCVKYPRNPDAGNDAAGGVSRREDRAHADGSARRRSVLASLTRVLEASENCKLILCRILQFGVLRLLGDRERLLVVVLRLLQLATVLGDATEVVEPRPLASPVAYLTADRCRRR